MGEIFALAFSTAGLTRYVSLTEFVITPPSSSGTNAMAKYMMNNLIIPQNEGIGRGILAQVPWHKHGTNDFGATRPFLNFPTQKSSPSLSE